MRSALPDFRVSVSRSLLVDKIETTFYPETQTLTHVLGVDRSVNVVNDDSLWSLVYCGIKKKGHLFQVNHSLVEKNGSFHARYSESGLALTSDDDLGLGCIAEALSVPVMKKGFATGTEVRIMDNDHEIGRFEGAFLFVDNSTRTVYIVMVAESNIEDVGKNSRWIHLAETDENSLSYALMCLKQTYL